jgi:hypothetical protein
MFIFSEAVRSKQKRVYLFLGERLFLFRVAFSAWLRKWRCRPDDGFASSLLYSIESRADMDVVESDVVLPIWSQNVGQSQTSVCHASTSCLDRYDHDRRTPTIGKWLFYN